MTTQKPLIFENPHNFLRIVQYYLLKEIDIMPGKTANPNRLMYMAFVTASIYQAHMRFNKDLREMDLIPNVIRPIFKSGVDQPLVMTEVLSPSVTKAPIPYPAPEPQTIDEMLIKPLYFVPTTKSEWLCHFILKDVIKSYELEVDYKLDELMTELAAQQPAVFTQDGSIYTYENVATLYKRKNPLNTISPIRMLNGWYASAPIGFYDLDQPVKSMDEFE